MILWLLLSLFGSAFIAFIAICTSARNKNLIKFLFIQTIVIFVIFVIVALIDKSNKDTTNELIEQQQDIVWKNNRCPVYKSSCGSYKHPYSCEKKAAIVGRNKVGDIFVDAYPIC